MINENKKVLLYSGGMDSWLMKEIIKPDTILFIHTHTESNELEYKKLMSIKNDDFVILDFNLSQFERETQNYFLPLRNLYFVALASNYGNDIYMGTVDDGDKTHYDNNEIFAEKSADLISYLLSEKQEGPVRIHIPFKDTTKTELLKLYLDQGGDIQKAFNETMSCYHPKNDKECMWCTSCMSKFAAFYNNGYPFKIEDVDNFKKYVETYPDIQKADALELYNRIK